MKSEVKIPSVGESITEVTISEWLKADGQHVEMNENLLIVETEKATVEVVAEVAGVLKIKTQSGQVAKVGQSVGSIDTSKTTSFSDKSGKSVKPAARDKSEKTVQTLPLESSSSESSQDSMKELSPAVRRMAEEENINIKDVRGSGRSGRVTKSDLINYISRQVTEEDPFIEKAAVSKNGSQRRVKMSTLRKSIAQHLVSAQRTAAILTTFNEVDMTQYFELKKVYGELFKERYGVRLGFLGLFAKACIEGFRGFPEINAFIEGDEFVYNDFFNFGIAVSTDAGLVVPVIRNVESLSLAEVEVKIKEVAIKARDRKLTIDEMKGGTFTISNGGVFGSLMSTPILNPPQSGILGLHKIEQRPIAVQGQVQIHPMMYIALSYDHRIVDGKGAVSFLQKVKESIEDPRRLVLEV